MDRRVFLGSLAGGLLSAPIAASAQKAANIRLVGFLSPSSLAKLGEHYAMNNEPLTMRM